MNVFRFNKSMQDKLLDFMKANKFERIRLIDPDLDTGQTVYLEQNNQILGAATLYQNAFHPDFEKIQFAVDTSNDKLVMALYEALIDGKTASSPRLSIHVNEADAKNLANFFARENFSLIIKTEFPQIDLEKSIAYLSTFNLPMGYRLENYSGLNETESNRLRDFRLEGYVKTHFWNPPLNIENPYWQETDVDAESQKISWVVFKDESLVLCSDAHIEENDVYLGWGWHDDAYESLLELNSIWAIVLKRQLNYCQQSGKRLTGEFDSLDKYSQYKSALLTHLTRENFYTYHQVK